MPKIKREEKKITNNRVDEVLSLTSKILKLIYIVVIVGIVLIATLLIKEWGILKFCLTLLKVAAPLFIGFIIAWILNPLVKWLKDKGLNKILATIIVFLALLIVVYLFFSALIPTVYNQVQDFVSRVPEILEKLNSLLTDILSKFDQDMFDVNYVKDTIILAVEGYGTKIVENMPDKLIVIIGNIFSGIGTTAISLIIGLYMLFDFDNIIEHFIKLIPKKNRFEIRTLLSNIGNELRRVVNGTFACAFLVFILASIGFAIVGLEAPVLFGLFCGITDLIPYIGPFIGGAAAVVVAFAQGPIMGLIVLVVVVIVQQLENLVIQPIVMSKASKLHPVTVIIALLVFQHFFGIVGMILATPVVSILKVIFRFLIEKFDLFDYPEYELEEK